MAPILATSTGVTPQVLDDPDLIQLLSSLKVLALVDSEVSLKELADLLEPWKSEWLFEEQVDLHEWIHPLNLFDSALTWMLKNYAQNLLLLPPFLKQPVGATALTNYAADASAKVNTFLAATSLEQLKQCPAEFKQQTSTILQFSAVLLRNSISKQLYASVPAVSDFLAAADDALADHAVAVLTALSLPPALHKQQAPEHQVHTTQLHQASSSATVNGGSCSFRTDVHDRLMATSRAWGTRAMDLGLYITVTADDSIHGQGGLPPAMGEVNFCYYNAENDVDAESTLQEISLNLSDMLIAEGFASSPDHSTASNSQNVNDDEGVDGTTDQAASKKRRKLITASDDSNIIHTKQVKSTAELFFLAVDKAGSIHSIPADRWFSLLADIRLARSFHSQAARCAAVCRRLQALIAILHAHPSHEMMSGYFQAQPELCVEMVDLLRPVVSSANVSAASTIPLAATGENCDSSLRQDAVSNLVSDLAQSVPFEVRMLAVEALTALVSRRDGSTGPLSGTARLSSVLIELGVGKGQYLGLLPTLIRYSLASLGSVVNTAGSLLGARNDPVEALASSDSVASSEAFDIGLIFVEATMAPPIPRKIQVERALLFIDNVLTLTSSVVGTPPGTSALVDCGLIPALLTTVAMNPEDVLRGLMRQQQALFSPNEIRQVKALLRFVTAQAVQILEGAIVTHNNALTAFHDLQGVEILTTRLSREISCTRKLSMQSTELQPQQVSDKIDVDHDVMPDADGDVEMEDATSINPLGDLAAEPRTLSSQRVLLFSIVTCLTVVFHQESSNSTTVPTGGAQIKKKELTDVILEILNNVKSYGGHLASLISTLLSDIMNSDPHIVHYVHKSGIANSFLKMVVGRRTIGQGGKEIFEPILPPVPELIMAIPNVISALALTEDGAKAVAECNPFPSLLRLFYNPKYAMPRSRCLLNEMTAIVGTGLDEIIRHVDLLKPQVLIAIAEAMQQVVVYAEDLVTREESIIQFGELAGAQKGAIENERSCLIQYVLNFGQLLEQILHSEEHCEPFVDAGGLDALLRLFPVSMPSCAQFLAYASCLSSPSVSTLHHSTTEGALSVAAKCIEFRYDPSKLLGKLTGVANMLLDEVDESEKQLRGQSNSRFSLDNLPPEPLYKLTGPESHSQLVCISIYLRKVACVQWITCLLANAIKAACQRSGETGSGWSLVEREWKKELSSESFGCLIDRLASFYRATLFEVCKVRTGEDFETRERQRLLTRSPRLRYRLRVVCTEGAVVRDGIEIDSCTNVGSLEMGDIVESFDRCINSSGILRYRTNRGWVSEMTRGHGREPIAEVISVWESDNNENYDFSDARDKKRIEAGVADIRSVGVGVLARGQASYAELFGAISKLVIQGIRTLPLPTTFGECDTGSFVSSMMNLLAQNVKKGLSQENVAETAHAVLTGNPTDGLPMNNAGVAMYLGCMFNHLHTCLFDDKRERKMVNFPLVVNLVAFSSSDILKNSSSASSSRCGKSESTRTLGLFDAIRFVLRHGLIDFSRRADEECVDDWNEAEHQRVGRSVAASFPPLILLLRKLVSTPMTTSPAASIMSRMKWKEVSHLFSKEELSLEFVGEPKYDDFFQPESLVADLQFSISKIAKELWSDERLLHVPPFLVHPIAGLAGDVMLVLEDLSKKKSSKSQPRPTDRMRLSDLMRRRQEEDTTEAAEEEHFEPSEDSVTRLIEMGFSRDHALSALESTRSNRVETAMDYALSNDPPSPSTIARLRLEREQRARSRSENQSSSPNDADDGANSTQQNNSTDRSGDSNAMDVDQTPLGQKDKEKESDTSALRTGLHEIAKTELDIWNEIVPQVTCSLLSRMPRPSTCRTKQASGRRNSEQTIKEGDGDGESEALTVVLCSFVLDLCQRSPEKSLHIVSLVFSQLFVKLSKILKGGESVYSLPDEAEASVAALCHAAVLITRALPKTRLLVLKEGLVRALVSCTQLVLTSMLTVEPQKLHRLSLPMWLAPSLLLLDIMAQPIVAFSDEDMVKSIAESSPDSEFFQVQHEHKEQVLELFEMANRSFVMPSATGAISTQIKGKEDDEGQSSVPIGDGMHEDDSDMQDSKRFSQSHFSSVPAYFPLLPLELSNSCLDICQTLLGKTGEIELPLPPGVAQSALLLLLRLLRTPKVSSHCLQLGVAEAILTLPQSCTFTGKTGLVTLVFRRLLEDEFILQSSMETEIRSAVTKLHAKKSAIAKDGNPVVSLTTFMEAVTPLLCRDPASFFKAMALSVIVAAKNEKSEGTVVSLLSPAARLQRVGYFAENNKSSNTNDTSNWDGKSDECARQKRTSNGAKSKGKLSYRGLKRGSICKKGKKEKADSLKDASTETPAVHITGLVVHAITTSFSADASGMKDEIFLSTVNLLEILADLVLAMPACASAVHNYRPSRWKDKSKRISLGTQIHHALWQGPSPPKSFVTFLLHSLLPQDRWTIRNDPQIWTRRKDLLEEESSLIKIKKKKAYRAMKISQSVGRVLLALVVRPGEGRKRVIADLAFALSCGRLGHGAGPLLPGQAVSQKVVESNSSEIHALHAWGEICHGIAAPRSNGKNLEGISCLSIENIRLMLECGLVHALLYALHRVRLFHPMASNTYGALLLPLEVLTRAHVTDAVQNLVKKERQPKEVADNDATDISPVDEAALGHADCAMEAELIQDDLTHHGLAGEIGSGYDVLVEAEGSEMDAESHRDDGGTEEVAGDAGSDDEEGHSSDEESGDDDETDESEDDDMDEDEGSEVEDSDDGSSEEVDEGGWDVDYNNSFADNGPDYEVDEEDVTERIEENVDEGWTRIESNGFGGMLMGSRRGGFVANNEPPPAQARGFIDAAEAMIGSLLRNGDISGDALAEIEGTLGIRIMQGGRTLTRGTLRSDGYEGSLADALGARILGIGNDGARQAERVGRGEVVGTLPHIHQRSQPDVGYSSFGRSGQWLEISSMEYVYGGPSVTGGSRNYDVVTPRHSESDSEDELTLTQLDLQLFPGGPASAANARAQHSLHPLLCGVDLPPMNSLVSDLLPHGVRATQLGQMTTRRPGDWTNASFSPGGYLVSTSNGNIIRSNRSHLGSALGGGSQNRNIAGPVGWTDDGLPVDATVEEFSSALEVALDLTARAAHDSVVPQDSSADSGAASVLVGDAGASDGNENSIVATQTNSMEVDGQIRDSTAENVVMESHPANIQVVDRIRNESDGVASTLVAGLRLTTENEIPALFEHLQSGSHLGERVGDQLPTETAEPHPGVAASLVADTSVAVPQLQGLEMAESGRVSALDRTERNDGIEEEEDRSLLHLSSTGENEVTHTEPILTNSGLTCPPEVDIDVFNSLPLEMQQYCVDQYNTTQELAAQLNGSTLDPEVLAALPEEMRREVIEQDRQERRLREQEQLPADPAHAEEMDNASFIASLAPELREEILLTADETFLNSLPPGIVAEAQILRERASVQHRRLFDSSLGGALNSINPGAVMQALSQAVPNGDPNGTAQRRRQRSGKLKVDMNRPEIVFLPDSLSSPFAVSDLKALFRLMFLLSPVQPPRLLQKVFLNLCANPGLRDVLTTTFIKLLHEDGTGALDAVESFAQNYVEPDKWRELIDALFSKHDDFPPSVLLGAAPEVPEFEAFNMSVSASLLRRKHGIGTAASMAANLPKSAGGTNGASSLPPVVAERLVDTVLQLCKSPRVCLHMLVSLVPNTEDPSTTSTCFEKLIELLEKPMYAKSSGNLDQLLSLLESTVAPLSHISRHSEEVVEISQRDIDAAAAIGKEYVDIPRVVVSQSRLQLLCSILRMESCRDTAFAKVNTIVRRLCRVEMNRGYVLAELASVAHALGTDAIRDLRALRIRMDNAVFQHQQRLVQTMQAEVLGESSKPVNFGPGVVGSISSSVTLSTSTSEMKLLRVLQTLQALCNDSAEEITAKKNENSVIVTEELVHLLRQMQFDDLWNELSACLKVVQVLEGVKTFEEEEQKTSEDMDNNDEGSTDDNAGKTKKLRNSAAGLLTRFLPSIEAFFVANASATRPEDSNKVADAPVSNAEDIALENLVGGQRMMEFVTTNRVLINALIRNNAGLLDKGLRALVQVPRCRGLLDFDVKRQWFKTQVRRLRQHASRRHGSLRLHIRRKYVFEDAYHQLQPRNADEMRGRLHVTFRNEEGVDAGGLSREFFGILAKEMFNPNYALFTSTEDGCTFQPNPNSIINPDHLSYFRFVGRVVGKAVVDGFLLDAHFTRSLYKHMLGLQPTHHDMEAIDPDYYRNLKTILEFNLSDIGLDLAFCIDDHSFGRSQVIDLIPNGRSVPVTEENKEEYVRLVCQHRMTAAIQSQIKSYLAGFYELVSPELIAIFTPRELELLISGLPDIDVHDLKKNTDYVGWKVTDKEIDWFWSILFSLSRNEKAAFLQFVTGSSKVPLAGFSELQGMRGIQKFSIHKAGGTKGALMSAHTCFNSLDLPVYDSEGEMREKLLYAINEGGGAFLFA